MYYIKVTPSLSRGIMAMALEYGYKSVLEINHNCKYLYIYPQSIHISSSNREDINPEYRNITFSELIELFESPSLRVGEYLVEFKPGGYITVGCESISYELLDDIHKKATELYLEFMERLK